MEVNPREELGVAERGESSGVEVVEGVAEASCTGAAAAAGAAVRGFLAGRLRLAGGAAEGDCMARDLRWVVKPTLRNKRAKFAHKGGPVRRADSLQALTCSLTVVCWLTSTSGVSWRERVLRRCRSVGGPSSWRGSSSQAPSSCLEELQWFQYSTGPPQPAHQRPIHHSNHPIERQEQRAADRGHLSISALSKGKWRPTRYAESDEPGVPQVERF